MERQKIRQSKKAIFLIVGLVQLNLFLIVSTFFPAVPIASFISCLMLILSVYLGGQSGIDAVKAYIAANGSFTQNQNQNRNEKITLEVVEREPRPRDFADWKDLADEKQAGR